MKIYNKKSFFMGIFMVGLGALDLTTDITNKNVNLSGMILVAALFVLGIGAIIQSSSKKFAKQERLEVLDERNQLIALKSKSKAFRVTQILSFLLMIMFLVMAKVYDYEGFVGISVGLVFALSISVLTELFTDLYYEVKN